MTDAKSKDLKIEHVSVEELIPYAKNARTHSDTQVAQIAASMTEFGFVNPILLGEDNIIIAGHGRLMAAKMLGMNKVPTIRLNHLNEAQRRALVIADNKIAENAGWDENLLREELSALGDLDFNIDLLGFNPEELDNLFLDDTGSDGFPKQVWEKDPSRNNEALDCRVYARAAASIYGLDRMSDYKWRSMEKSLGQEVIIPTKGVEMPVPATPQQAQAGQTIQKPKRKPRVPQRKAIKADDPYL